MGVVGTLLVKVVLIGPAQHPVELCIGLLGLDIVGDELNVAVVGTGSTGIGGALVHHDDIPLAVGQSGLDGLLAGVLHLAGHGICLVAAVVGGVGDDVAGVVADGAGVLVQEGRLHAPVGGSCQSGQVVVAVTAVGVADGQDADGALAHLDGDDGEVGGLLGTVHQLDHHGGRAETGVGQGAVGADLDHVLVGGGVAELVAGHGALGRVADGDVELGGLADVALTHLDGGGSGGDAVAGAHHKRGGGGGAHGVAAAVGQGDGQLGLTLAGAQDQLALAVGGAQVGVVQLVGPGQGGLLSGQVLAGDGGGKGQLVAGHAEQGGGHGHGVEALVDLQVVDDGGIGLAGLAAVAVVDAHVVGIGHDGGIDGRGGEGHHAVAVGGLGAALRPGLDGVVALSHGDLDGVPAVITDLDVGAARLDIVADVAAGGGVVDGLDLVGVHVGQHGLAARKLIALEGVEDEVGGGGAAVGGEHHIHLDGVGAADTGLGDKPVAGGIDTGQLQSLAAALVDDVVQGVAGIGVIGLGAVVAGHVGVVVGVGTVEGVLAHGVGLEVVLHDDPALLALLDAVLAAAHLNCGSGGGGGSGGGAGGSGDVAHTVIHTEVVDEDDVLVGVAHLGAAGIGEPELVGLEQVGKGGGGLGQADGTQLLAGVTLDGGEGDQLVGDLHAHGVPGLELQGDVAGHALHHTGHLGGLVDVEAHLTGAVDAGTNIAAGTHVGLKDGPGVAVVLHVPLHGVGLGPLFLGLDTGTGLLGRAGAILGHDLKDLAAIGRPHGLAYRAAVGLIAFNKGAGDGADRGAFKVLDKHRGRRRCRQDGQPGHDHGKGAHQTEQLLEGAGLFHVCSSCYIKLLLAYRVSSSRLAASTSSSATPRRRRVLKDS